MEDGVRGFQMEVQRLGSLVCRHHLESPRHGDRYHCLTRYLLIVPCCVRPVCWFLYMHVFLPSYLPIWLLVG
jgi:hypothetical protein